MISEKTKYAFDESAFLGVFVNYGFVLTNRIPGPSNYPVSTFLHMSTEVLVNTPTVNNQAGSPKNLKEYASFIRSCKLPANHSHYETMPIECESESALRDAYFVHTRKHDTFLGSQFFFNNPSYLPRTITIFFRTPIVRVYNKEGGCQFYSPESLDAYLSVLKVMYT